MHIALRVRVLWPHERTEIDTRVSYFFRLCSHMTPSSSADCIQNDILPEANSAKQIVVDLEKVAGRFFPGEFFRLDMTFNDQCVT